MKVIYNTLFNKWMVVDEKSLKIYATFDEEEDAVKYLNSLKEIKGVVK